MDNVNSDFGVLQARIREHGLLQPDPAFYICRVSFALILIAVSITVVVTAESFWLQMTNAVLLAFAFGQIAGIMHDVGHGQVVSAKWFGPINLGLTALLAFSVNYWIQKHNRHHAFPNQPGYDPDVNISMLAFSREQARRKRGLNRLITCYQGWLFTPLLFGEIGHLRINSIAYLLDKRTPQALIDLFTIGAHFVIYGALLLYSLPIWTALAFAMVNLSVLGLYMGLIFAPNHKGMPMFEHDAVQSYMKQQVLPSRNVRGGWLTDMIYMGLNYQIEHHLFPSMPRSRLKHAAPLVEQFCLERGISYRAVGIRESLREIFGHLARVGRAASKITS